jgi:hypothetical protein
VSTSSRTESKIASIAERVAGLDVAPGSLRELYDLVEDPRAARGKRHPIGALLACTTGAVAAGYDSYVGISQWVDEAGTDLLGLGGERHGIPSEATIRRALQRLDGQALDNALGARVWAHRSRPVSLV